MFFAAAVLIPTILSNCTDKDRLEGEPVFEIHV